MVLAAVLMMADNFETWLIGIEDSIELNLSLDVVRPRTRKDDSRMMNQVSGECISSRKNFGGEKKVLDFCIAKVSSLLSSVVMLSFI